MYFYEKALEDKELLSKIRREFHQYPELGFEEYETSKKIKQYLNDLGIEHKSVAKTGIKAIIRGKGTKTVALRADMDALPMQDKKECDYKSKITGKMHACGHDAHMTILLGAAKILKSIEKELNGNVVLFLEPAEETVGGSRYMIEEGVLENPHVDAVIGLHVDDGLECGTIGIKYGIVNAASNTFTIKIKGKGAHGAYPHMGIDPIVMSCNVINTLQTLVSRETSPTDSVALTIGSIHGGTAENIIPEEVEIKGTVRTLSSSHRQVMKKRLREVVEGVTSTLRGEAEIDIVDGYPCLTNDDSMVKLLQDTASEIMQKDKIINLEHPSLAVESFAYFSTERPSVFYSLGCRSEEKGIIHPLHNSLFDIDEDCLPLGAALQALLAYRFLNC